MVHGQREFLEAGVVKSVQPRARHERLLVRPLAEELLVYDLDRHNAVCLNRTAAAVWQRCDGATDVEAIASAVTTEIEAPFDTQAVWCALDGLEKRGLVEPLGETRDRPARTRRQWLRDLGRAGLSGALIPAILAVVAPSAAEAASTISKLDCADRMPNDPGGCGGTMCSDWPGQCRPSPSGGGMSNAPCVCF